MSKKQALSSQGGHHPTNCQASDASEPCAPCGKTPRNRLELTRRIKTTKIIMQKCGWFAGMGRGRDLLETLWIDWGEYPVPRDLPYQQMPVAPVAPVTHSKSETDRVLTAALFAQAAGRAKMGPQSQNQSLSDWFGPYRTALHCNAFYSVAVLVLRIFLGLKQRFWCTCPLCLDCRLQCCHTPRIWILQVAPTLQAMADSQPLLGAVVPSPCPCI